MAAKDEKAPGDDRGGDSFNTSEPEYGDAAWLAKKFPSWDPAALLAALRQTLSLAKAGRGSTRLHILGVGDLLMHFGNSGEVRLDPESSCTRATLELARACRLLLGEKFDLGKPAGARS